MEKELSISKKDQARDAMLLSLSGGVIGIIGAIAEGRILSAPNPDTDTIIWAGGATLVGAGLAVSGAVRYIVLKRSSKNSGK